MSFDQQDELAHQTLHLLSLDPQENSRGLGMSDIPQNSDTTVQSSQATDTLEAPKFDSSIFEDPALSAAELQHAFALAAKYAYAI